MQSYYNLNQNEYKIFTGWNDKIVAQEKTT